ncbi:hypothetical protein QBC35DRAFT_122169 [Podospora australis]|uniref:Uncharacterized protein n=1 Tax=Podospora australis TaxID=1536484 RepID=A0AAN6WYB5_9PEZI|nr:hypothetical protein QBC35DRAFT_122169 [Podospora australis]
MEGIGAGGRIGASGEDCHRCYYNATILENAGGPGRPDPCLQSCLDQFRRSIIPSWEDTSAGWAEGCRSLTNSSDLSVVEKRFWSLYWCDMKFCGVAIDQNGGKEQDPMVDKIINTCQNNGFHDIHDPGPPSPSFACVTSREAAQCPAATMLAMPDDGTGAAKPPSQPVISISSISPTAASIPTQTTFTGIARISSLPSSPSLISSSRTKSTTTTTATSDPTSAPAESTSTTTSTGLSSQGKIALAVCMSIGAIVLLCLALLWVRGRRRRNPSQHHGFSSKLGFGRRRPQGGSPTPLISPASSAVGNGPLLTPPLRLRDRKFLPSILRSGNRSPSPPLTPLTPAYSPQHGSTLFPTSPICTPTTSKLVPRNERTPRAYTGGLPPIPPMMPSLADSSRGSASSYSTASIGGATTTTSHTHNVANQYSSLRNEITSPGGTAAPNTPTSPARPPRPHDSPLQIPDLITAATAMTSGPSSTTSLVISPPLSPPPTRALPLLPQSPPPPHHPYSFISNSSDGGSITPTAATAVAGGGGGTGRETRIASTSSTSSDTTRIRKGTSTLYHHGRSSGSGAVTGYHHPRHPDLSRNIHHNAAHLAEEKRDERGSWGSWSGTGMTHGQQESQGRKIDEMSTLSTNHDGNGAGDEAIDVSPRTSGSTYSGAVGTLTGTGPTRERGAAAASQHGGSGGVGEIGVAVTKSKGDGDLEEVKI